MRIHITTSCFQQNTTPQVLLVQRWGDGYLEWYIGYCGGVHFAANSVSASPGFSRRKVSIFWGGADFPHGTLHDILPLSQKREIGHLRDAF